MRSRIAAIAEPIARKCTNAHAHVHKWVWPTGFLNVYIFGLETARAERKIIMYANPRFFTKPRPLTQPPQKRNLKIRRNCVGGDIADRRGMWLVVVPTFARCGSYAVRMLHSDRTDFSFSLQIRPSFGRSMRSRPFAHAHLRTVAVGASSLYPANQLE